jgi:hypothetical protein
MDNLDETISFMVISGKSDKPLTYEQLEQKDKLEISYKPRLSEHLIKKDIFKEYPNE